jgi:hypothetical protein
MRMKPGSAALSASAAAALVVASLVVASLGGCASSFNVVGDPFVAPAKFQYLRCEDIAKRLVTSARREQELRTLMDRASAGTGGSTVNIFVYQPEYQTVQSELRQLHEAAVEKHCPDPPKADVKKTDVKADPNKADTRTSGS